MARDALQSVLSALGDAFNVAWTGFIKPVIDGLFSISGVSAIWESIKDTIGAVLDWLSAKFAEVWAVISPVIDALKWARDKGGEAMAALAAPGSNPMTPITGPVQGPISSGPYTGGATGPIAPPYPAPAAVPPGTPRRAQGGGFWPGPVLVGERGPELRYESHGGFIAHNGALRGMIAMSERIKALARSGASAIADTAGSALPAGAIPAYAGAVTRQISYAPQYNIAINGSGLDAAELRRAVLAELQAHTRRAQAEFRGRLHD